jgi:hypothetical protein
VIASPWKPCRPVSSIGPVDLPQQPVGNVQDAAGIDAEQVAIEREVVDRTEREPVDDGGDPLGVDLRNDVRGLHKRSLAQTV